jgi:phenylalanine-4-hydroxylase
VATHAEGFGTPIGRLAGATKPLEAYDDAELAAAGLVVGQRATLRFASGVVVDGRVTALVRHAGQLVRVSFAECRVTLGERLLFDPAWGAFDMAVGETVTSVYAGAADKARFYGHHYQPSATELPHHAPDAAELRLNALYGELRALREASAAPADLGDRVAAVVAALDAEFPTDWLARLEAYELLTTRGAAPALADALRAALDALRADPAMRTLIDNGLALLVVN